VDKGGISGYRAIHITRLIVPQFNIRAGHIIVPVGLTNAHHEPIMALELIGRKERQPSFLLRGMKTDSSLLVLLEKDMPALIIRP
jgi:hypothetical protein